MGDDLGTLQHLLGTSEADLAAGMCVSPTSLYNGKTDSSHITMASLNGAYDFAHKRGIRLNRIKEQLYIGYADHARVKNLAGSSAGS